MKYIEIEREDKVNHRYEYELMELDTKTGIVDILDIAADPVLVKAFEDFMERGIKPEWSTTKQANYRSQCDWFFYVLTKEEFEYRKVNRREYHGR
jgi:hypothetical protein